MGSRRRKIQTASPNMGSIALRNMQPVEIRKLIIELEQSFPVDSWQILGFEIWPILRVHAYINMSYDGLDKTPAMSFVSRVKSEALKLCSFFKIVQKSFAKTAMNSNCDVICLSDGISFQKISGEYWEKFLDPIREQLAENNIHSTGLDPSPNELEPRHLPFNTITHELFSRRILGLRRFFQIQKKLKNMAGLNEFFEQLKLRKIDHFFLSFNTLSRDIAFLRSCADYFKKTLLMSKAKLGLQVSYYRTDGYAFNLACKELNIPSVDIQHGVTGSEHLAYGNWSKVPVGGFSLLPSHFWAWSDDDVATITAWSLNVTHQAFAGGHPLSQLFKNDKKGIFNDYSTKIAKLANRKEKKNVLISLQPFFITDRILADFCSAITSAPANFQWWIRVHPCNTIEEINRVKLLLPMLRNERVIFFEEASEYPLMPILAEMDIHITHSSSVVLEALAFNVPSIVIDPYGEELFSELIRNGRALFCPSGCNWEKTFKQLPDRKNVIESCSSSRKEIAQLLSILDHSKNQQML